MGGWVSMLFIYIIKLLSFLISGATGAATPGCSGTLNAVD